MPQPRQSEDQKSEPREGELPAPPEELSYSRDATHSTYAEAPKPEQTGVNNPPPGPQVEQTLGKPTEASE